MLPSADGDGEFFGRLSNRSRELRDNDLAMPQSPRHRPVWHALAIACFALTFVAYFWSESYADVDGPRHPSPQTAQTVPLSRHGRVVYLTAAQEHQRSVLLGASAILLVVGFAFEFVANWQQS